jgi:hypothetical protein
MNEPAVACLEPAPPAAPKKRTWKQLRWSTRICLLLTRLLILVVFLEVASRVYWLVAKKVPTFHTNRIINSFFPELAEANVAEAPHDQADGVLDVLVLGPSVWNPAFGDMGPRFEKALAAKLGRPVRVFNASFMGNTSRDALIAYKHMTEQRFDLVVVYHGINDLFLNNCPPEMFRADYSHAPRYEQLRLLDSHPEHPWFVLPYTVRYLRSRIGQQLNLDAKPNRAWAHYGANLQTPPVFRSNVQEIIDLARARNAQVLLLTFAWYLPENYSEEAFAAKTLDYDCHASPVSTWGTPANLAAGLKAHNEVLRGLVNSNPDLLSVDIEALMPAGKQHYDDICHLSPKGCEVLVDLLIRKADWGKLRMPSP